MNGPAPSFARAVLRALRGLATGLEVASLVRTLSHDDQRLVLDFTERLAADTDGAPAAARGGAR